MTLFFSEVMLLWLLAVGRLSSRILALLGWLRLVVG
jgi:hypothetical protein